MSSLYILVREHIPLEQGLRLSSKIAKIRSVPSQRAYSIRTRIKTNEWNSLSISTIIVREHIPLEQGLRLLKSCAERTSVTGQRAYSIRTRIKTAMSLG